MAFALSALKAVVVGKNIFGGLVVPMTYLVVILPVDTSATDATDNIPDFLLTECVPNISPF